MKLPASWGSFRSPGFRHIVPVGQLVAFSIKVAVNRDPLKHLNRCRMDYRGVGAPITDSTTAPGILLQLPRAFQDQNVPSSISNFTAANHYAVKLYSPTIYA